MRRQCSRMTAAWMVLVASGFVGPQAQGQYYGLSGYPTVPELPFESSFGPAPAALGASSIGLSGSVWGDYSFSPYSGYGSAGGWGFTPYSGYGVAQGQPGIAYQATGNLLQQAQRSAAPQTRQTLQPVYDIVTSAPGWSRGRTMARHKPRPALPREQLLDESGAIRWPMAMLNGPSVAEPRRQAEEAVRGVVAEGKKQGHASIRQVIDARTKLASFARVAVPEVKLSSAADASRLESFVVELRKSLETMAVKY